MGLALQFIDSITAEGVDAQRPSWARATNHARILTKGDIMIGALFQGYAPKKLVVWGVSKKNVENMQKDHPDNWVVAFLLDKETGYCVHARDLNSVKEGPYENERGYESYRVHEHVIKATLSKSPFCDVRQFLQQAYIL